MVVDSPSFLLSYVTSTYYSLLQGQSRKLVFFASYKNATLLRYMIKGCKQMWIYPQISASILLLMWIQIWNFLSWRIQIQIRIGILKGCGYIYEYVFKTQIRIRISTCGWFFFCLDTNIYIWIWIIVYEWIFFVQIQIPTYGYGYIYPHMDGIFLDTDTNIHIWMDTVMNTNICISHLPFLHIFLFDLVI